jgi:hypothetical protein
MVKADLKECAEDYTWRYSVRALMDPQTPPVPPSILIARMLRLRPLWAMICPRCKERGYDGMYSANGCGSWEGVLC